MCRNPAGEGLTLTLTPGAVAAADGVEPEMDVELRLRIQ